MPNVTDEQISGILNGQRIKRMFIHGDELAALAFNGSSVGQGSLWLKVFDLPPNTKVQSVKFLREGIVAVTLQNDAWPLAELWAEPPQIDWSYKNIEYRLLSTLCQRCGQEENAVVMEGAHGCTRTRN